MTREHKNGQNRWVLFYSLLAELHASPAARRAQEIVFGRNAAFTLPAAIDTRKKKEPTPQMLLCATQRLLWLSGYRINHTGATDSSIYKAVNVDRRDWHRWKNGELPDSSAMAIRIKKMLTGEDSPHLPH